MKIALHAELVLMSAPWKLFPRAISIRSIRIFAPIAVPVQMFVLLRQSTLQSNAIIKKRKAAGINGLFYCGLYRAFSRIP